MIVPCVSRPSDVLPLPPLRTPDGRMPPLRTRPAADAPGVRILLVEDEHDTARLVARRLHWSPAAHFAVTHVSDLPEALARLEQEPFDAILLDLSLPGSRGVATLGAACVVAEHIPVVVLTGSDDDGLARAAVGAGAQDYLVKDRQDARTLSRALLYAIARHRRESRLSGVR